MNPQNLESEARGSRPRASVLHPALLPRRLIAAAALAACASLALGSWPFDDPPARAKGGPHLGFFLKRGTAVERGANGDTVYPEDEIRFVYTADRAYHLALISGDASVVYFPNEPQARQVEAGGDVPLDAGFQLNAELGSERIVSFFCDEPVAVERLRAAVASEAQLPAEGCKRAELTLHKSAKRWY